MTPCDGAGRVNHDALVATAERLMAAGMTGVVYCGSMGDWPLLSDEQRRTGVERLVAAGVPVVVGTGAPSPAEPPRTRPMPQSVGAAGLMVIPRVLSRGPRRPPSAPTSPACSAPPRTCRASSTTARTTASRHAPSCSSSCAATSPTSSATRSSAGAQSLSYAAEHITSASDDLELVVGVDTEVVHGIVNCGAAGVITGIGNVLPEAVLRLIALARAAADGDPDGAAPGPRAGAGARTTRRVRRGSRPRALLQAPRRARRTRRLRASRQPDGCADRQPAPLRRGAVRALPPVVGELGRARSPRRRRDARVGVSLADFPVVSVLTATNVGGWACRQRGDGRCGDRRRTSARSG